MFNVNGQKVSYLRSQKLAFLGAIEKSQRKLKMNRILLLAMLCVASGSCVKLENICSHDSFEYKGLLVNAFYKVQWNVTFGLLDDYLINDTIKCNPAQFSNKTNLEETLRLKNE